MSQRAVIISRRAAVVAGLAAAAGLTTVASARADSEPAQGGKYARRAQRTYGALQRYFYDPATSLYRQTYPRQGVNPWSFLWPFSQAKIATQVMAGIPAIGRRYTAEVDDRYNAVEAYWNPDSGPAAYDSYVRPPLGQGGGQWYDDNEWIGLGLMQRHYMTPGGHAASVERAKQIFDLVVFGWDTDPSHPFPGGVFWNRSPTATNRNTVSNAPGAELGLHLYFETGDDYYLEWALRMYEWVRGCLLAPNGLYWDNVNLSGVFRLDQFSYNQGTMIGAGVLLHRATGDRTYLEQARDTATQALAFYAEDERYFAQPARFHAIFFANLLQLWAVRPDPAYRKAMAWYAEESRARFLDPETGLYRFTGENPVLLLEQAGMVRIEGMLAWAPRDYPKLT
ncbi:glycoside hydrolase family 76 protein [Actinopolymorpha alba]|uniref:glycoside hydrolase family 76 protein n=1 Tax=Actinopolymorpha alba TaxID=533267 RepID=UPI00035DB3DF|nr:glycoside hydrolase family 76 protein [Actinopolymorpha alba]